MSVKSGDREEKVVDKTLRVTDRAKKGDSPLEMMRNEEISG
ncbi:hypothetical protein ACIG2L_09540 [Lysinibacillus fusiformis]